MDPSGFEDASTVILIKNIKNIAQIVQEVM